MLGGGCIYVYNCFLIVYIVCIFAGLVMVDSGGLGRTICNQVGCWQPNLGQAFSSKALVYESVMTDPRINSFFPRRMCCRLIRVTCRWGILPITWDASHCVSSMLGGGCICVYKCFLSVYILCIFAVFVQIQCLVRLLRMGIKYWIIMYFTVCV